MKRYLETLSKEGGTILIYSLIFNVLETAYFGWNMEAMSRQEEICDVISTFGFLTGFVLCWIHLAYYKKNK